LQQAGTNGRVTLDQPSQLKRLAGVRAQYQFALPARLFLIPSLDVQSVLTRITLLSGQTPLWTTSPVSVSAGVFLGFHFL
jgi:hypothetical protein